MQLTQTKSLIGLFESRVVLAKSGTASDSHVLSDVPEAKPLGVPTCRETVTSDIHVLLPETLSAPLYLTPSISEH
jgi:hypothetical protein